jgi:hypothetical protein
MSDLPSDAEDMFFMEAEEIEEYQRKKRMKYWEDQRRARIEAIAAQQDDNTDIDEVEEIKEGKTEEVRKDRNDVCLESPLNPLLSPAHIRTTQLNEKDSQCFTRGIQSITIGNENTGQSRGRSTL